MADASAVYVHRDVRSFAVGYETMRSIMLHLFHVIGCYMLAQVDALAEMDEDATIRCAIQCLQAVTDFRGNEVRHSGGSGL